MIQPLRQHTGLLADIRSTAQEAERLHIWWLGQSGFLMQWNGRHLLFDPYLSDSLTRKYACTDKPHTRMSALAVEPEGLDFVGVVTSSHNHTDHLDAETLQRLARTNPELVMVCPEANRAVVRERCGLPDSRIIGLEAAAGAMMPSGPEACAVVKGFKLYAIPAAHETVECDKQGRHIYLGFVVKAGPWTLYHSGDTILFPGMADRLRPFHVDVALLPINGRAPERRVAGNLWGREAAQLAHAMGARCVIPCHYDMFTFNTASPDEFVETCHLLGQPCAVLRIGERWSLPLDS